VLTDPRTPYRFREPLLFFVCHASSAGVRAKPIIIPFGWAEHQRGDFRLVANKFLEASKDQDEGWLAR
jgi:hypothetical protein